MIVAALLNDVLNSTNV